MDAPADVVALAQARAKARAAKEYARSDELRDELAALGWVVKDTPDGYVLSEKPPYDVIDRVADLPTSIAEFPVAVGLVIEGWPDDVRTCVDALLAHSDAQLVLLDAGNVDGAGDVVHELAVTHPDRIIEFHLAANPGWAAAQTALLNVVDGRVHVVMDVSSVLDGDAISVLVDAVRDDVVAAGWKGANVDTDDAWRSVVEAGPGDVDVVLSYLMAVDRAAARITPPHPKARFYRNADLEWSLLLREAGGRIVVPEAELPVHQERHRGYHDSDPEFRDRESKKTYDRILARFRGKNELLHH